MTETFTGQTVEAARRTLTLLLRQSRIDSAELDARTLRLREVKNELQYSEAA